MGNYNFPTISVNNYQPQYHPNESIEIKYNLKDKQFVSGSCWIGLIPAEINNNSETINDQHDVDYYHVNEKSGKCVLRTNKVGRYRIKCFANDNGGKHIVTCNTQVFVSYIKINEYKNSYTANEEIEISYNFTCFNNRPEPIDFTYNNNWIGIIPANIESRDEHINDNHDTNYIRMQSKTGTSKMKLRRNNNDDLYEIRVFPRDNGGQQIGMGIPLNIYKIDQDMQILVNKINNLVKESNKQTSVIQTQLKQTKQNLQKLYIDLA